MPPEEYLRDLARQAITADTIPTHWPDRIWDGPGIGASCALCAQPVHEEFAVHWAMDRAGPRPRLDHFHHRCFAAWELERKAARESGAGRAMSSTQSTLLEACERRCPACQSERIGHTGHGFVSGLVIKAVSRCEACGCAFWLVRRAP
jgi:hypothetical protein